MTTFATPIVLDFAGLTEPPAALADVWPRLAGLMRHLQLLRQDEPALQEQQRGAIKDGCYLMPAMADGDADRCDTSWFHDHQVYYRFHTGAGEIYFLITGLLDRAYSLDTVWFPARSVAVTNYPSEINADKLTQFAAFAGPGFQKASPGARRHPGTAIIGFPHFMHVLWNELPALDRLDPAKLPADFTVRLLFEPFGPTGELFPELRDRTRTLSYAEVPEVNASHDLVVGLGSWRITAGAQRRVRRVAAALADPSVIAARDQFRSQHRTVFWLSIKPPNRTLADQAETLAALMTALAASHPECGFILDGVSLPWDHASNANYGPWFAQTMENATQSCKAIIGELCSYLSKEILPHIVVLNGVQNHTEIVWGEAASFYVCHGGTMQNKIGWIHRTPGFIHSNQAFLRSVGWTPDPVENGSPCYLASFDLIVDDEPSGYSDLELARKDQNYRLSSVPALVAEVNAAISISLRQ